MTYLNQKLYKKAWLLEFRQNGTTVDAFTFSVPAQSEDFQYPQRINETKTFGGVVYDDYGKDTGTISLSGTSINQEIKLIFRNKLGNKYLKGSEEVLYLKDLLDKWGENTLLLNKEVYLIPLDPNYNQFNQKENRVLIKDYSFKRTKDSPLTYFYTINFACLSENTRSSTAIDKLKGFTSAIEEACRRIEQAAEFISGGMDIFQEAKNILAVIKNNVKSVENACNTLSEVVAGYFRESASIIKESVKLGDYVITSGSRITLNTGVSLFNAAHELNKSCGDLINFVRGFKDGANKFVPQDLLEKYQATEEEIRQDWLTIATDIADDSALIVANSKKEAVNTSYAVIPGGKNEDDKVIITYGFVNEVVTTSTTWEALAVKYYGDASLGTLIAVYNSTIGGNYQLNVGDKIYIPILVNNKEINTDNEIYTNPQIKDNYGNDIAIDSNGEINIHLNDYTLSDGVENLAQAINCRLNTEVTARIRNLTYGIKANIGSNDIAKVFVLTSINQTLLQDPRVKTVDSISFIGKGENIQVDVHYTDINGVKSNYGGLI